MSIPKMIHQFWEGELTYPVPLQWMEKIVSEHPGWEYKLWNAANIKNLGILLLKDGGSWATVSNIVRLFALQRFGGVYLDCDIECLKPLDPLMDVSAFAAYQDEKNICNAVMGAEPYHPWIEWQLDRIYERTEETWGVSLATDAPRDGVTIYPNHYFYPFLWDDEKGRQPHPESYLVHHWLMSWCK